MALRSIIEWKYAGVAAAQHVPEHLNYDIAQVGIGQAKPVEPGDGHKYWVSNGYYVPYFESHHGSQKFRDFERMIGELTDRFFRNAQPEINRQFTAKAIADISRMYELTPATKDDGGAISDKQTLGSRLVGGMINRMGRLAQAILEKRKSGDIPDTLEIEGNPSVQEMHDELSGYFNRLMRDTKLVSYVRRNQGMRINAAGVDSSAKSPRIDRDGVLHEMIQEVGKAAAFRVDAEQSQSENPQEQPTEREESGFDRVETQITQGRVNKIGRAMRCVDQITELLNQIASKDPALSETPTAALLKDMGDAAKALLGLKKSDVNNYMRAEVLYESRQKDLNRLYFKNLNASETTNQSLVVIQKGFDLIKDMASTRLACDEVYWPRGSDPYEAATSHTAPSTLPDELLAKYGDPSARMYAFAHAAHQQMQKLSSGKWSARIDKPKEQANAGISAGLI